MAVAPDVILTGRLGEILAGASTPPPTTAPPEFGTVEVALCGYGSQIPRVAGDSMFALVTQSVITQPKGDPNAGAFEIIFYSNRLITPEGTYYTVTIKDSNGDIVQVDAYVFPSSGTFDLTTLSPFDPSISPPSIPPLIFNQLQILGAADDMVFDGANYTAFKTTLGGDVTQPIMENMVPGNLYTFIIVQDGGGGHRFLWPPSTRNGALIDPRPNATTIQTFVCDENSVLWAIGPGTAYL